MRAFRRGVHRLVGFGAVAMTVAACGGVVRAASKTAAPTVSGRSASCAGLSRAEQFKAARVVLVGVMLPGPSVGFGDRAELSSPAKMRVGRYLKGQGPSLVRVQTAVKRSGNGYRFAEDGIEARAGQRWKINSDSKNQPYSTSVCAGSKLVGRPKLVGR